jgi:hypothetical protein
MKGEDVFKLTVRNESLHEPKDDNEGRVVNFATSANLVVKELSMSTHCRIH